MQGFIVKAHIHRLDCTRLDFETDSTIYTVFLWVSVTQSRQNKRPETPIWISVTQGWVTWTLTRSSADADNLRDAFSGQSRSTNTVPFNILGIVSYCTIVTLSFRRALFTIFDFKKFRDLEIGVRGHSMSLKVVSVDRPCMVFEIINFKNAVTLKTGLGVR